MRVFGGFGGFRLFFGVFVRSLLQGFEGPRVSDLGLGSWGGWRLKGLRVSDCGLVGGSVRVARWSRHKGP